MIEIRGELPRVNVVAFGARGVGSTDSAPFIASAKKVRDESGGSLYFPPGVFRIGANLTLDGSIELADGAVLQPGAGITLTFSGTALLKEEQVFDCSLGGSVSFVGTARKDVRGVWFGDESSPAVLASALSAAASAGIQVYAAPKTAAADALASALLVANPALWRALAADRRTPLPPYGFGWDPEIPITKSNGVFSTAFDVALQWPFVGTTYYVGYAGSSDTVNNGLSTGASFTSITKAVSMAVSGDTIQIAAGAKVRTNFTFDVTNKSLRLIGDGAGVTLSNHDLLTWTVESGSCQKATRSGVTNVCDSSILDAEGDYIALTLVADVATCIATPGSYYTDNVTVWVRPADSRVLGASNTSMRAYVGAVHQLRITDTVGGTYMLVGIGLEGGSVELFNGASANRPTIYWKGAPGGSVAKYCANSNAVTVQGCKTYFQNITAARARLDCFNYHVSGGVQCWAAEINCTGRSTGTTGLSNNNGSTMHDGGFIMRLNGVYRHTEGPCVADVNSGTKSWNLGCAFGPSVAIAAGQHMALETDCEMWVDGGTATNVGHAAVGGTPTSTIHTRGLRILAGTFTLPGTAVVDYYY